MTYTSRISKALAFANMSLRWIRSYPQVSLAYLFVGPLFFLGIAVAISGTIDLRSLIVPAISVSVSNSLLIGREFWEDKKMGLDLHYMLSMTPIDYILGYMLSKLILTFAGVLIIFALSSIFLGIGILGGLLYAFVPIIEIWLFCCSLGFLIGIKSKELRSASMTGELSWLLLLMTSPTLYNSVAIPQPFRYLLLINPITFAIEALKSSFGSSVTIVGFTEGCSVLGVLIILLFVGLLKSFRWRL